MREASVTLSSFEAAAWARLVAVDAHKRRASLEKARRGRVREKLAARRTCRGRKEERGGRSVREKQEDGVEEKKETGGKS